jgi:integrase
MAIYKRCPHAKSKAAYSCEHDWWGQKMHGRKNYRVNLAEWSGEKITGKLQAEIVFDRMKAEIRDGTFKPEGETGKTTPKAATTGMPIGDVAERYIAGHLQFNGIKGEEDARTRAIAVYYGADATRVPGMTRVEKVEGGRMMPTITTADVREWIMWLRQPYVPNGRKQLMTRQETTVDRFIERFRAMYIWAIGERLIPPQCNPFKDFETGKVLISPTHEDNTRDVRATEDDLDKILAEAAPHVQDLIYCAVDTGIRRGELMQVTFADIEDRGGWIRLPAKITKGTKKNRKPRYVPITTARVVDVIERYRFDAAGAPKALTCRLFSHPDGTKLGAFRTAWEAARRRAGLKRLRWHDLRHEFGSRMSDANVPLQQIQKMMGHRVLQTTMRYLSAHDEQMAEAARLAMGRYTATSEPPTTPPPTISTPLAHSTENGRTKLRVVRRSA